ncbi:MAG: SHOCT domain-containing protein [Actinomycetota bacterium]|nr:SHOCT domain-containing protein [Actinomycetota bacterium]
MMFWYGNGGGGWGYALMTLSMIAFWGLVIFGVIALVRYLARAEQGSPASAQRLTPAEVLADRFARGEIDEHEYHERRNVPRPGNPEATPKRKVAEVGPIGVGLGSLSTSCAVSGNLRI